MYSLIISLIAIALQAAALFALMNYTPQWAKTGPDHARVLAAGLHTLEHGFYRYAAVNGGGSPLPTETLDGGLEQFQSPVRHLSFIPKAPEGFFWRYGWGSSDYYVCLQPLNGTTAMSEGLFYGVKRLRQLLPHDQLVISAGADSCGSRAGIGGGMGDFPAVVSVTYFMRYAPGATPGTSVLPCEGTACLLQEAI